MKGGCTRNPRLDFRLSGLERCGLGVIFGAYGLLDY